uniref:Uncharacterized protein n=1 Tax=viral metagenome TaxID=1070528 RepID=A0A6C0AES1_9ZZZZ
MLEKFEGIFYQIYENSNYDVKKIEYSLISERELKIDIFDSDKIISGNVTYLNKYSNEGDIYEFMEFMEILDFGEVKHVFFYKILYADYENYLILGDINGNNIRILSRKDTFSQSEFNLLIEITRLKGYN